MLRQTIQKFLIILVLLIALGSCDFNSVYNETVSLKNTEWHKDEAIRFDLQITDSLVRYDFYLNLRNTTDYRYSNLYVFLTTRFPNGNTTRDTIEILLADKQGKWLGKGWSNLKENNILLKNQLQFPLTGNYVFFIQQAMRVDLLEGIQDVGLQIDIADD